MRRLRRIKPTQACGVSGRVMAFVDKALLGSECKGQAVVGIGGGWNWLNTGSHSGKSYFSLKMFPKQVAEG